MTRHIVGLATVLLACAGNASAQPADRHSPFRISDNSFLVEEAFNQEAGVFQNIFGALRLGDAWVTTFTQEWPIASQAHQFSYTLAWMDIGRHDGTGDVLLNYRYQAMAEGRGRPAFSPRLSLVLPTGNSRRGLGAGSAGLQANLPFSKQTGDVYWHWNAGLTWLPGARLDETDGRTRRENLASPFLAGSGIYRFRPMVHLMLESLVVFDEHIAEAGTARNTVVTVSPGFRAGWNIGDHQAVLGFAVPITWSDATDTGAFIYFSYELPFRR